MTMEISAMYEALDNMDDYALMANVKPIGPHKVLTDAIAELEQLRQRVAELEKERDEEIARNRPLRNLIASLEEQKSHWNKCRNENREAVATLDSERAANAKLSSGHIVQLLKPAQEVKFSGGLFVLVTQRLTHRPARFDPYWVPATSVVLVMSF